MRKEILDQINQHHIRHVDKLYRMWGGVSSSLGDVRDRTLYITVKMSNRWKKTAAETALQFAKCWRDFNPQLSHINKYCVTVMKTSISPGITVPGETLPTEEDTLQQLAKAITAMLDPAREVVYNKTVFEGVLPEKHDQNSLLN